ncbi:unnamed protein product, partial [Effrenium voratum]
ADVLQRMEGNQMFRLFFEVPYHNKPELNRIFPESVHDCSAMHVCSFILSILHQGIFSVSAFIVSVIYLSRFKESSRITLHACTWRPLFLTSLLLADKMWEDKPVRNSSLAKLFPVLSNIELNKMESEFLDEIKFNVLVKPDLFCSFCEKLLAEQVHQEISRCVIQSEYAATLQADCVDSIGKVANGKNHQTGNGDQRLVTPTNGITKVEMKAEQTSPQPNNGCMSIGEAWSELPSTSPIMPVESLGEGHVPAACRAQSNPDYLRGLTKPSARSMSVPYREGQDLDPRQGPVIAKTVVVQQQPMRRSLPAKSNIQYVPLARAPSVGSTAARVPGGCEAGCGQACAAMAQGAVGQSPRSPTLVRPQLQGSSQRSQTPPSLACSQAVKPAQTTRAAPVVAQLHAATYQPKPRSSSAPRVHNMPAQGANVRASSQPMQPYVVRQVPAPHAIQAQFSGGQHPYARQVMVSDPGRATSPVNMPVQMGRAPVTRGSIGSGGYPVRNASPGIAPTSPAGVCGLQVGGLARGRSPAPEFVPGVRGQRAGTPTSLIKGMPVHGMVQRNSLGPHGHIQRPGFVR